MAPVKAAAAVFVDDNNVYFFASFGGYLCRFDEDQKVCFDGQLKYSSPNAGVIVGATFYYSKNLGRDGGETIHFVTDIGSDSPTQVTSDKVAFSSTLFEGAVLDFAAVDEADGVSYVEDGDDDLAYLLGLGADFEVVVIRLDNDGHPDAYAVLESTVEWGAGEEGESGASARPTCSSRMVMMLLLQCSSRRTVGRGPLAWILVCGRRRL